MCLNPVFVKKQWHYVPCGKCVECAVQKSNEWAFRIALEARLYERNCMITLTYNEDNLPPGGSLIVRDYQLFLKRLRKKIGYNIVRYFLCGEYGDLHGRPHFHIILFNYDFNDKYWFCRDNKGTDLYRSPLLEKLWDKGFSSVGEVTYDTAKYCAIYMQKKPTDGRLKPFIRMSKKPSIGYGAINTDMLISDKIYFVGKYIKIPRYFLNVLERENNVDLTDFKLLRRERAKTFEVAEPIEKIKMLRARKRKWKKLLKKIDKSGKIV